MDPVPEIVGFFLSEDWRFEREGEEVAVPGTVVEVVGIEDAGRAGGALYVGRVLDAETLAQIGDACRTGMRWRIRRWWFEKAPGAPLPEKLTEATAVACDPRATVPSSATEDN